MTRQTFYRNLRKVAKKYTWVNFWDSYLRAEHQDGDQHCPITLVQHARTGKYTYPYLFRQTARELGLSDEDATILANAADKREGYNKRVRKALERAIS
jgi:hypothetical protein